MGEIKYIRNHPGNTALKLWEFYCFNRSKELPSPAVWVCSQHKERRWKGRNWSCRPAQRRICVTAWETEQWTGIAPKSTNFPLMGTIAKASPLSALLMGSAAQAHQDEKETSVAFSPSLLSLAVHHSGIDANLCENIWEAAFQFL